MAVKKNTRNRPKNNSSGGLPIGPMLLSFAVGVFVMFLIHLKDNVPADQAVEPAPKTAKRTGVQPTFDFYTLLPESEEVVARPRSGQQKIVASPPEKTAQNLAEITEAPRLSQPESVVSPPVTPAQPQSPPATAAATPQETFMIQVGSFRRLSDADGFRANLALLGVESKVQTVTIDNKDTFHRVQVGPIVGRQQADAIQRQLRENNIDSLLLRAKHG